MKIFLAALLTLWLLFPSGSIGQTPDSAKAAAELARDSTLKIIRRIPYVGSVERRPDRLVTDSTLNFNDYRYAGDLIARLPGVFLYDLGSAGQLHGLSIDGLGPRAFTFMADGVLLNDPLTGVFDPYLYPTEHFERMEIITGPRALLYGIEGTGAAINFVSKSRKDIHPYSRIRFSEASYGTGFLDGMFSQDIIRGLNMTGGFSHRTSDGEYHNSPADGWNGRLKLRYNITPGFNLYASEMYNQTQLGLNGGVDLAQTVDSLRFDRVQTTLVNTDAYEKVTRHDLQLGAALELFPDSTAVTTVTFFHSTSLREYRDEENREGNNGLFVMQDHRSQWYGVRAGHHHELGATILDAGAEVQSRGVIASDIAGQKLTTFTTLSGTLTQAVTDAMTADAFLRLRAGESTTFTAGADLSYAIVPGLTLHGGLGSSTITPPVILDLPARTSLPAQVAADSVHSIARIGLSWKDAYGSAAGVAYTRHVVDRRRIPNSPEPERLTLDAVEASLELHAGWLYLGSAASYVRSAGGILMPGPRWSGNGELAYWGKLADNHLDLKAGFRVTAFSGYNAVTFDQQYQLWLPSADPAIPGSAVVDFTILAQIGDAHVHLIWENLLDRKYVTASFFPMGQRQLRFGVSWDLID